MLNYPLHSSPRLVHHKISTYFSNKLSSSDCIGTPSSLSGEASWSTPQMQDNAFSSEEYDADDEDEKLDLDYK